MNNILIINLRRYGDIYTSEHLINSIIADSPHCRVSMLVFEEFKSAAKNLRGVSHVYGIDRNAIISFKKNRIYNDGFALDLFFSQVSQIQDEKWSKIINFSNDQVGTYITSCLTFDNAAQFYGVRLSKNKTVEYSNEWAIVFNDILTSRHMHPIHFIDCYHNVLGIERHKEGEKLVTSIEYNETAFKNFKFIREQESVNGSDVKIIGIQLKSSRLSKDIKLETIVEFINLLLDQADLVPVLLVAPTDAEKEYADKINARFDNKLVSIEADLYALPSVLMNLDVLVTPDTVVKHVADLLETPVVEVSLGEAPFLKQGTCTLGSVLLTPIISQRDFSVADQTKLEVDNMPVNEVSGLDIYHAMRFSFNQKYDLSKGISEGVSLYQVVEDNLGVRYSAVAGDISAQRELMHLMARQFLLIYFDKGDDKSIYEEALRYEEKELQQWIASEKESISEFTKVLLGTLRSLLTVQDSSKRGNDFITVLDILFSYCEKENLISIPTMIFRAKLETMCLSTNDKNIKQVESLLYKLKSDVQQVFAIVKHLSGIVVGTGPVKTLKHPTDEISVKTKTMEV